jgi:hypothetical protein
MKKISFIGSAKIVSAFLTLTFLVFFQGCKYYYKVQPLATVTQKDIRTCDSLQKFLILHQGKSAWHLFNPGVTGDMLCGTLVLLPSDCQQFRTNHPTRTNRYRREDREIVLKQVHLYVKDSLMLFKTGDSVKLDFAAISKAEIYVKASGRTTVSWVVPITLGGVAAVAVIAGAVAVATKSSCPLIYIRRDSTFAFTGEIFGGAIYASLERHDYLPLPGFVPTKNRYELKITNGLPEIQYINLAELMIVSHPANVTVLTDRHGKIYTTGHPEYPTEAVSVGKADILPLISMKDRSCFQFDETPFLTGDTCAFNSIFLSFPVPARTDSGKLVIRAGNSMWGDYAFGELTKLFGNRYEEIINWQGKRPPDKTLQWQKDQRYPLSVYVETASGWKFVDYFDLIGPLGARDMIMAVGLYGALFTQTPDHGKVVRIKIESGYKFWDLDYAAMDFSTNATFTVDHIQPTSAITEEGNDVTQLLLKNDSKYYVQKKTGEEGQIVYQDSPEAPGWKKSVFLHTKGYYTHVRNYPNPPDKRKLQSFLIPGRFSRFSYDTYAEFIKNRMVLVSDPKLP